MNDPADTPETMLQQGRALRALARSILRSADDADDVVQDAFATALSSGHEPQRPGWWVRVVQNLARRRLRDRARRDRRQQQHAQLGGEPSAAPDDVVAQVETHRLVADTVLQLGEPYRTALVLRFWHDLPPRAIAQRLGLPVATVKTHLQRGLVELRRRLDAKRARRDWVLALVPIAWPQLAVGAAGGTSIVAWLHALWMLMNTKLIAGAVVAVVMLGMVVWQPWLTPLAAPAAAQRDAVAASDASSIDRVAPDVTTGAGAAVVSGSDNAAIERDAATQPRRTCLVVGRIVLPGGLPAAQGRMRFVDRFEREPDRSVETAADGSFSVHLSTVAMSKKSDWLSCTWALADAPGFAVRSLDIDARVNDRILDGRLDLGTFELERGVAVAGRVVEADGSPLRDRVRLLAWDPARRGSFSAMEGGRTVGLVEPGGAFELAERLSANPSGAWVLCAIGPSGIGWADLTFAAGQEHLDPIELRLLGGGGVDVRVVDGAGMPMADVEVCAQAHFSPIGLDPMWPPEVHVGSRLPEVAALFSRRTDTAGRASFRNLPRREDPRVEDANRQRNPARAIMISASRRDAMPVVGECDPAADGAVEVELQLLPRRRVTVFGRVTMADGGAASGIRVRYNGYEGEATCDADGRFELPEIAPRYDSLHFLLEGDDVPMQRAVFELPPTVTRIEHDFVAVRRAAVHGRVVDQHGTPVAGVELHLGRDGDLMFPSEPRRTGPDGVFAFPDALLDQDVLSWSLPEPVMQWRGQARKRLERRDDEVVQLERLPGPFLDLMLQVVDAASGALLSPSEVEVYRLLGREWDQSGWLQPALAHGAATVRGLLPGRYRAIVYAGDEQCAFHDFDLPADAAMHVERVELWPTTAGVFTVDLAALAAARRAALEGAVLLTALDGRDNLHSFLVDDDGKARNFTANTGVIHVGRQMSFRLERVPCGVPLRMRLLGDEVFGEAWFVAQPGAVAEVRVAALPHGEVRFVDGLAALAGALQIDVADGGDDAATWRPLLALRYPEPPRDSSTGSHRCAVGEHRFRARHWSLDGGDATERTGTFVVRVGETTTVTLD